MPLTRAAVFPPVAEPRQLSLSARRVLQIVVALTLLTSTFVFTEPAPTDALMAAVIVAMPILGLGYVGPFTRIGLALWLVVVACGLVACAASPALFPAVKHQIVTLFLVLGALALAAFVALDPVRHSWLALWAYLAAALLATLLAVAGYFRLAPGAFELFTSYGRARGSFKDPNVYAAALVPAIAVCAWLIVRPPTGRRWLGPLLGLPLALGLLVAFSRGAWLAAAIAVGFVAWICLITSRRKGDLTRLTTVTVAGIAGLAVAATAALQLEAVQALMRERASLDQSYDHGPEGRFGGQMKAVQLALSHPFGIGTHTFREVHHAEEAHNVYLTTFLNAGWLGGLAYIAVTLVTLLIGLRGAMRNGHLQGPMVIATAAFLGIAVEGAIIDSDHWRHFFMLTGLIWGLADATAPRLNGACREGDPKAL